MAAMRRLVAGMARTPCPKKTPFPPSIYPVMREKIEVMKKVGAPTEKSSKLLLGIDKNLKVFDELWLANERKAQGLLRDRVSSRAIVFFLTVGSAACLAMGADVFYNFAT